MTLLSSIFFFSNNFFDEWIKNSHKMFIWGFAPFLYKNRFSLEQMPADNTHSIFIEDFFMFIIFSALVHCIAGDGRMNSPGHCAKFCTYTVMSISYQVHIG